MSDVLLLTHSQDFYTVDLVADALRARGARPVRVDTDRFPGTLRMRLRNGASSLHLPDGEVQSDEVEAVWFRHLGTPKAPEALEPGFASLCEAESAAMLEGFLSALSGARWVNDRQATRTGENKFLQLEAAARAGLRVPRTLATNDPAAARAFFHELGGEAVMKLQVPLSAGMGRTGAFLHTTPLREADLEGLDSLALYPVLFQERIRKDLEYRVACVDGRCLAGAVRVPEGEAGGDDWRQADPAVVRWQQAELPSGVEAQLARFMSAMGLRFGAVDLILTPEGETVFLEVNPTGEWGMLEHDLGLPIAAALAGALLDVP